MGEVGDVGESGTVEHQEVAQKTVHPHHHKLCDAGRGAPNSVEFRGSRFGAAE